MNWKKLISTVAVGGAYIVGPTLSTISLFSAKDAPQSNFKGNISTQLLLMAKKIT